MKKIIISTMLLLVGFMSAAANDIVSLKFNRTGTDAASVAVSVVGGEGNAIEGASASLTSVSSALRATAGSITSSIVCPNVNANTSPTITMTFTVAGLPEGYTFDKLGLHIHALNGSNGYQETDDNKVRQWNVSAAAGDNTFASFSDIDIAAGISGANKLWETSQFNSVGLDAEGNLVLTLTITKGTDNGGCFFGLSEVRLVTTSTEPEPEPDPTVEHTFSADKVYYIQWKNTGANYITENRDKSLTVADKKNSKCQFWRLIPVEGKSHCYTVQNVVTENYLGSCNMTPSSSSRVSTSADAVEYYIGATAATSGEIAGCHYFSSTDCDNYSDETAGPRALNKDGASSYVITWTAGVSNVGSYWKIVETTEEYQAPEPPAHGSSAKNLTVYFRPCGMVSNTYLTAATIGGVDPIAYAATAKPGSFYVPFSKDHGAVVRGSEFNVSITLSSADDADLKANAYFDWNADGEFEITAPITLNGTRGTATVTVPADAVSGDTRMRIRLNSNGLDRADDDVEGFVYDIPFAVVDGERKVLVDVNASDRGTATLSGNAETYAVGTQLTATATPKGNATFHSWREGGVVVSRESTYTFAVANRNMTLKAYFTPGTEVPEEPETTEATPAQWDFTFTRTSTTAADVLVANGGVAVEGVTATIAIAGGYQEKNQTASNKGILCIDRNTVDASASNPNAYTLTITNSSNVDYAFDYVVVGGVALNNEGIFQTADAPRDRMFQVTCGATAIEAKKVSINDSQHCNGKETFHAFAAPMTIPAGKSYTITVNIYNDTNIIAEEQAKGCFYGLSKIALGNTTVSFGTTGYATLYAPIALTIPEGVTAYTGTLNEDNTWLTLAPINNIIPKEHAVILKGETGTKYTFEAAKEAGTAVTGNALKGQTSTIAKPTEGTVYTLQSYDKDEDGVKESVIFRKYLGEKVNGGRAYIVLPANQNGTPAQSIGVRFEDGTTDIEHSNLNSQPSTLIYDLMGRRVEKMENGIYIVNGKKIVVK